MDLLKVKVENFRCFEGPHEVDMTEGPLWVVRGENGSGKSTLVCDSILFALFNTIPSLEGTQSLKKTDLINLKSKFMNVQIWFNHNGNRYSIRRSYKLKGKHDTLSHQFEAWENNKEIINTPKQDDARIFVSNKFWEIEDFRNTTIILQKEITNSLDQRESERKKSIEKIFNIERFAKMSEVAHTHARDTDSDIKILSNNLEGIKKQIVDEQELKEKKFTAQESIKSTTKQKETLDEELKKKKKVKESLDKAVIHGNNLKDKIKEKNTDLKTSEKEKTAHQEELLKIESELAKEPVYLEKIREIEKLEAFLNGANEILELAKSKEKQIDSFTNLIRNKEENAKTELNQFENSKTLLSKQLDGVRKELNYLKESEALVPKLEVVVNKLPELNKSNETFQKQLEKAEILERTTYKKEQELEMQKKNVQHQLLDLEKKNTKLANLEIERKKIEESIAKNKIRGKELEFEVEDLEELTQKEQELKNTHLTIELELKTYKKSISDLQNENKDIKTLDVQGVCPKCKQQLNAKHIADITAENNQKIAEFTQKFTIDENKQKNLAQELTTINKQVTTKQKNNQELEKIKVIYKAEKSNFESIQKQITELGQEMKSLQELKAQLDRNELFSSFELEISSLKKQIPEIQQLKAKKKELEQQILQASRSESQLIEVKNQLKNKPEKEKLVNSLITNISDYDKKIESKQEALRSKSYASEEQKVLVELQDQLKKIRKEIPDIEEPKEKLKELQPEQTRTNLKSLEKQKGIKEEKIKRIQSIEMSIKSIIKDIKDFEEALGQLELDRVIPDVENYRVAIEKQESELAELTKTLVRLELELQSIADQEAKNNQFMNDYKAKRKEFQDLKQKKDDYDLLADLFKDIGKRILNRVISRINIYSTEILSRLGNDQLEQITLVESKSGFELKIISAGEERYPNWFSGGQKVRIGLAFRLSLSRTLAEVTGGDIETILIDEGDFGALDDYGLKGVAEILNDLKNFFKRMVIVTHMEHLANELDGRRLLIKDSQIELEKT